MKMSCGQAHPWEIVFYSITHYSEGKKKHVISTQTVRMIWGIQNRIRVRRDHCGAVQLWNLPEASYNIPCCIMGNAGTGQVRPTLANLHYTQTPKMWPFISLKQPSTSCLQFIAEVGGLNITPQLVGIDINQNCEVMFLHMWLLCRFMALLCQFEGYWVKQQRDQSRQRTHCLEGKKRRKTPGDKRQRRKQLRWNQIQYCRT